jgi:peptidyl-prolyl cis-trans isomerase C
MLIGGGIMCVENQARRLLWVLVVSQATVALVGCGHGSSVHQSSQVVAVVNDKEITVSQVNQALRGAKVEAVTPEVTRQAVDSLVAEELLVQDALRNKMDRDPGVVQAIEHSRRRVLAEAFAEKRLFPSAAPTNEQIEAYYRKNPALFANRKLFRFTTFSASRADMTDPIRSELNDAHSVEQVRAVLERHAISYSAQISNVSPEQIPMNRLPAFASAAVGDVLITESTGNKLSLMCLTSTEDNPVALEQATPMIREFLTNASHQEALAAYIKQSKATAKIAYTRETDRNEPVGEVPAAPPVTQDARLSAKGYAGLN